MARRFGMSTGALTSIWHVTENTCRTLSILLCTIVPFQPTFWHRRASFWHIDRHSFGMSTGTTLLVLACVRVISHYLPRINIHLYSSGIFGQCFRTPERISKTHFIRTYIASVRTSMHVWSWLNLRFHFSYLQPTQNA